MMRATLTAAAETAAAVAGVLALYGLAVGLGLALGWLAQLLPGTAR